MKRLKEEKGFTCRRIAHPDAFDRRLVIPSNRAHFERKRWKPILNKETWKKNKNEEHKNWGTPHPLSFSLHVHPPHSEWNINLQLYIRFARRTWKMMDECGWSRCCFVDRCFGGGSGPDRFRWSCYLTLTRGHSPPLTLLSAGNCADLLYVTIPSLAH